MSHRERVATNAPTPPAIAGRLGVLIAGGLVLAGLAVPLKIAAARSPGVWSALGGAARAAGERTGDVADFAEAAVLIARSDTAAWRQAAADLVFLGADGQRIGVPRIRRFLARHGSPMTRYSADIVAAGIRYRVDPRVVVAIAGVESTYGRYCRGHNAWGWGSARWKSWPTAIDRYTRALSIEYRSLRTGRFMAASRTYCPPCGGRWGVKALRIFRSI